MTFCKVETRVDLEPAKKFSKIDQAQREGVKHLVTGKKVATEYSKQVQEATRYRGCHIARNEISNVNLASC